MVFFLVFLNFFHSICIISWIYLLGADHATQKAKKQGRSDHRSERPISKITESF